MYWINLD